MAKVKVKRQDTFIDMTAMSDVTVLLLTFFMLTSTFIQKEPVQITTPGSVSDRKVPETDILTVLIDKDGHVYMSMDNQTDRIEVLKRVGKEYNIAFTVDEIDQFKVAPSFGVPIGRMQEYLKLETTDQDKVITQLGGIPYDSTNNQLSVWLDNAKKVKSDFTFAIKAAQDTPYHVIKEVMDVMRDLRIDRYSLITTLKTGDAMPDAIIIQD